MVDSGTDCNLMRENFFRELQNTKMCKKVEDLWMADGTRRESLGRTKCMTEINGDVYGLEYRVVPVDCLL